MMELIVECTVGQRIRLKNDSVKTGTVVLVFSLGSNFEDKVLIKLDNSVSTQLYGTRAIFELRGQIETAILYEISAGELEPAPTGKELAVELPVTKQEITVQSWTTENILALTCEKDFDEKNFEFRVSVETLSKVTATKVLADAEQVSRYLQSYVIAYPNSINSATVRIQARSKLKWQDLKVITLGELKKTVAPKSLPSDSE